jgi:hypothetical protein
MRRGRHTGWEFKIHGMKDLEHETASVKEKKKGQPGEELPLVRPQGRGGPQLPDFDYGR